MTCVCLISKFDLSDLFTYMSNRTSSQVGQKNNHISQNDQWF